MHTGTNCGIRGHSIAALIACLAMAVTGVAGATAGSASAAGTGNAASYKTYASSVRFSAGKSRQRNGSCTWCALSGGAFGVKGNLAHGGARALPTSVTMTAPASFEFATLTAAPSGSSVVDSPVDVSEILGRNIAFASDKNVTPVRFVGGVISRLESSMNWRSNAFSIAGSRVWSKIIKFSSTGVNVRLPLN